MNYTNTNNTNNIKNLIVSKPKYITFKIKRNNWYKINIDNVNDSML